MKKIILSLCLSLCLIASTQAFNNPLEGFTFGNPGIKSVHALAFSPEGILFVGDSKSAKIIALDLKDNVKKDAPAKIEMLKVDQTIAALLGTTTDDITIQDMAVNPVSKMIYFAVHMGNGTVVLLRTAGDKFENISLTEVSFSEISLEKAVAEDAKDSRGRSLRQWAISDLAYSEGNVMVSGLSNEEFSSTFRVIPFPFQSSQTYSSLEIYHAAHGKYETYAPIKTFMPYKMGDKNYLMASYTCTPLVLFDMAEMKTGSHVKGKTVAELGNRNTPLDIITYVQKGKTYILLSNTSRSLMKIDPEKIANFQNYLTNPVSENSATAGVEFIALPYVLIQQMDKLSDTQILLLQRSDNGSLNLHTPDNDRF